MWLKVYLGGKIEYKNTMATRETQNLIIETAIALFNQHGTKAISTNRIAEECGLSRGNLHYHFRTKEEIIQTIFQRIDREMDSSWYKDHEHPTMEYTHFMFARQIDLIWRYRFFYRELYSLLQNDARLKLLFMDCRKKRVKEVRLFFDEMINAGLMVRPEAPVSMDSLLEVSWLITDQWLPNLDLHDKCVNEENIEEGFKLIMQVFEPYFTPKAKTEYQQLMKHAESPKTIPGTKH